jgi:GNAT superfamily N-acetyltransferase
MTVRRLGPRDWELLREVRLRSLADAPAAFGSTYEREFAFDEAEWRARAQTSAWFVVRTDHGVSGIVAGRFDPAWPAHCRVLVAMWVAPQARGTGGAMWLIDAVAEWARDDHATELILGVVDDNARARALYEKSGFAQTGAQEAHISDPNRHVVIYSRPL